jgi:integrase
MDVPELAPGSELPSDAMARTRRRTSLAGIRERHARSCPTAADPHARCRCSPSFEAFVYSAHDGRKVRKSFASPTEAKQWRAGMLKLSYDGGLRVPAKVTLREAAERWLGMAEGGAIRTRSGDHYKPSALRGYEQSLRLRLLPPLGAHRLSEVTRPDLQRLVARWHEEGLSASSIRNTINALRAIYRSTDLLTDGTILTNPTIGLRLPAVRGKRERIAAPDEAARLVAALPEADRALWGTALYAGLRLGELQALTWADVDLAGGTISVVRSLDPKAGPVEPKSRAGRRRVPIAAVLRELLIEHRLGSGRESGLVFSRTGEKALAPSAINDRAQRAWRKGGLRPIGLHECRHTCASYFIAAGVNAKTLSTFMGHANITTTLDRYGHLFPGSEAEAAGLLDAYLARADTTSRISQLG